MNRYIFLILSVLFIGTANAQYVATIDYPKIAKEPFTRLVHTIGYYNDEELGWKEYHNATGRMDEFKQYEIRRVTIEGTEYYMLAKLCSSKMNFFVIEKSEFNNIKLEDDKAHCNRLAIKYYGSVKYQEGDLLFEDIEQELMNRIVYHDNLAEALDRFDYAFCINTYYDYARKMVKFYTCLEQKSKVDEYVSLKNCMYRKSYTDIFVSPELFNQRYLEVDVSVFKTFWQIY